MEVKGLEPPKPIAYQAIALPTELHFQIINIELSSYYRHSTDLNRFCIRLAYIKPLSTNSINILLQLANKA